MSHHTTFAVSRFENRNGVISWRVDGQLHGLRIRRNFKTREAATAEKAALGEAQVVLELGDRTATGRGASTDIIEASVRAYINAVNRLVSSQ